MKNSLILNLNLLFITTLFFVSCTLKNPRERNKLNFRDSINNIIDSIQVLNNVLIKTGIETPITYGVEDNQLYIDNTQHIKKVGLLSDTLLKTNQMLSHFEEIDRNRFLNLVVFLNENYIDGCNFEINQFIYFYRSTIYMADYQEDLMRFVVLANSEQDINFNKYKILDKYKNLYLLADKDAHIWEN